MSSERKLTHVCTDRYLLAHGRQPRRTDWAWAFNFVTERCIDGVYKKEEILWWAPSHMKYTEAKNAALKAANERGDVYQVHCAT